MTIRNDYECSSGNLRTWEIPTSRLINTSPIVTEPAAVNGLDYANGEALTGVVIALGTSLAGTDFAVLDFAPANVYYLQVRNVLTYAGAVEATWGALNIGDPVYYDDSATMPAGVQLSTSPLDNLGNSNVKFGTVVGCSVDDMDDYPKGGVTASTQEAGVMLIGAGLN